MSKEQETSIEERKVTKAEVSRLRVLDAAAKVLREKGYAGTTMRTIAAAAEVDPSSIYYHFPSKDALIDAVFDFGMNAVANAVYDAIATIDGEVTPRERLEFAVRAHIAAVLKFGDYTVAIRKSRRDLPRAIRRPHSVLRDAYGRFWHQLLLDSQREGIVDAGADITRVRLFLLDALNAATEWFDARRDQPDSFAEDLARWSLHGIVSTK
jgi:AcrR family transcriptional regulator